MSYVLLLVLVLGFSYVAFALNEVVGELKAIHEDMPRVDSVDLNDIESKLSSIAETLTVRCPYCHGSTAEPPQWRHRSYNVQRLWLEHHIAEEHSDKEEKR